MPKTAIQVRVTAEQRDEIKARADKAGLTLSDYVRTLALGEVEAIKPVVKPPSPAAPPPAAPPPAPSSDPGAESEEAFVKRRTGQLRNQGKTTRHAEQLAKAEWAKRG